LELALPLLVAGIFTDHPHHAFTADNAAGFTKFFDGRSYFHGKRSGWEMLKGEKVANGRLTRKDN
jgi:hypothetical protein